MYHYLVGSHIYFLSFPSFPQGDLGMMCCVSDVSPKTETSHVTSHSEQVSQEKTRPYFPLYYLFDRDPGSLQFYIVYYNPYIPG